jgi:hypothetical protein
MFLLFASQAVNDVANSHEAAGYTENAASTLAGVLELQAPGCHSLRSHAESAICPVSEITAEIYVAIGRRPTNG